MATKKTENIARREPVGGFPAEIPAHMRGLAGRGVEEIGPADIEIPRIKLIQALSPEVADHGVTPNTFFHTIAEIGLGSVLHVIICYVNQSFILWRPRGMGGGILARAADGAHWNPPQGEFEVVPDGVKHKVVWKLAPTVRASGLAEWGTLDPNDPKSPPAATRMYNLAVWMPDHPAMSPAVVTLQRSAVKVARKLMGKLKIAQVPTFGIMFKVSGVKDRNPQGQEFFNFRFEMAGYIQDQALFGLCKGIYERLRAEGLRIRDVENLQDETEIPPNHGDQKY